jgi:DNA-binding transcriptional ArsR family regulator
VPVPLHEAKAELFRALGHPARIRILELLVEGDQAVHQLLARMDIEQSNLSQQLAVLRRHGLVRQQRIGGEVIYSLVVPGTRDLLLAARMVLHDVLVDGESLTAQLRAPDEVTG